MAIDNYLNNITSQHRDKPKFIAWLSANLEIIDDIYNVIKGLDNDFDLDNAIGKQLDTLGIIIGRERTLDFQPLNGSDPVMNDDTYRLVLKAKRSINNWNGTIAQMYEIWDDIFNDIQLQIKDNQDMSFNAYIMGFVNQMRQNLIVQGYIIPKPEGVKINYIARTPINSKTYIGMITSSAKKQVINMPFDFNEKATINANIGIIVSVAKRQVINMPFDFTEHINLNSNSAIKIQQNTSNVLNVRSE